MLIFLIGYMGSGKSVLGKQLAEKLHYRLLDTDEMIQISTGYSITDYFLKFGEMNFRKKERELLENHLGEKAAVIATGGGTPCFEDNMEFMNKNGITVFIDTRIETILARLSGKILQRPLLDKIPNDQLPEFIREHMNARRGYYEKAKIRIDGDAPDLDSLIKELLSLSDSPDVRQ